jgi:unsaturated rhamnogalacturonyl hydrolase
MNYKSTKIVALFALAVCATANAQKTDATAPLHLMQPDYPTPYVIPQKEEIKVVLDRVYNFLDKNSASKIVDATSKVAITDYKKGNQDIVFEPGAFRLTSYEWGVTYAGMLLASKATGEKYFADYTNKRIQLIADIAANYDEKNIKDKDMLKTLHPEALDFAGALCAAFIKAKKEGLKANADPLINNYIDL